MTRKAWNLSDMCVCVCCGDGNTSTEIDQNSINVSSHSHSFHLECLILLLHCFPSGERSTAHGWTESEKKINLERWKLAYVFSFYFQY